MKRNNILAVLGLVIVLVLLAFAARAQDTLPVKFMWSAPTEGTTPVSYSGEIQWFFPGTTDTFSITWYQANADTTFMYSNYKIGSYFRTNVWATDEHGISGPPAIPSEWFIHHGFPGQPSQAVIIEVGNEPVE